MNVNCGKLNGRVLNKTHKETNVSSSLDGSPFLSFSELWKNYEGNVQIKEKRSWQENFRKHIQTWMIKVKELTDYEKKNLSEKSHSAVTSFKTTTSANRTSTVLYNRVCYQVLMTCNHYHKPCINIVWYDDRTCNANIWKLFRIWFVSFLLIFFIVGTDLSNDSDERSIREHAAALWVRVSTLPGWGRNPRTVSRSACRPRGMHQGRFQQAHEPGHRPESSQSTCQLSQNINNSTAKMHWSTSVIGLVEQKVCARSMRPGRCNTVQCSAVVQQLWCTYSEEGN